MTLQDSFPEKVNTYRIAQGLYLQSLLNAQMLNIVSCKRKREQRAIEKSLLELSVHPGEGGHKQVGVHRS